ncbi:hypothetical protein PCANC_03433 [Puccinia coronata f. sp. avenae]|uniref:Uncharacterized protein n=1 Tax=Puccinia coronata f. sp. avenae TaxID=200324 RepID=A0A2N5W2H1_9BASI|nr:hypothetical protein PCANC_03433 [Puccinia coronata f. sp. avenae]
MYAAVSHTARIQKSTFVRGDEEMVEQVNKFFDLAGSGNETRFVNPGAGRLKDEMTTYAGTLPA